MDLSNPGTAQNLEAAFAGESMANRKYLFFAEVVSRLGMKDLAKLFKETAQQETEHAFAHFRQIHPELVVADAAELSEAQKKAIASRCLELAIEGETYEYTTMYPQFAQQASQDRDAAAAAEFVEQQQESQQHATQFAHAAHIFGLLVPVEQHHANQYSNALYAVQEHDTRIPAPPASAQKWICRKCSMIYDPALGDPDSGIAPGTAFEAIPTDWICPICGAVKATFVPYIEAVAS